MIPPFIRGAIAPVFTAFNQNGALDPDGQRSLLDFLAASNAISAYFVRSGMGQMFTFSYEDVCRIAKVACDHLRDRAPVLVGASGIWDRDRKHLPDPAAFTTQSIDLCRMALDVGAAGVVLTLPEAIEPGATETYADVTLTYFEAIAEDVALPILIYQSPGTPKPYRVTIDLIQKLAALPNVTAIKLSSGDAGYLLDITYATRNEDFAVIAGNECAFYAALCSGARAVIGQGAALNPAILNAVQNRFEKKDYPGAIEAQHAVNLLVEQSTNAVEFLKRYATEQGYPIPPHARQDKSEAYPAKELSQHKYDAFKKLLDSQLTRFD